MTRRPRNVSFLACCWLLALLAVPSPSQGPIYRERWGYLHLERLRDLVLQELAGRAPADVAAVGQLLVEPDGGVPFRPVARALADLRGVEADAAFLLRATIGVFVLPEVVDPESTQEACTRANFSVFLPYPVEAGGQVSFELAVRNNDGDVVWRETLERDTETRDLRMARPRAAMPIDELPDGLYHVEVRTLVDGQGPRAHDPQLQWPFHVLRGYQARAEAATAAAREVREGLEPTPRALLDGLAVRVSNAYVGQAFVVASDAVRELQRLELGLQNLAEERPVLAGMHGDVRTALPGGEQSLLCALRLPDGEPRPRKTVVFVDGTPSYDGAANRPNGPLRRAPGWLQHQLGGFGVEQDWNVVCIESPGGSRPFRDDLLAALDALGDVLPCDGKPLLVCDREAGAIVAMHLAQFAPKLRALVTVGSGAMPLAAFDALQDVPVRMVALAGYSGSASVDRMIALVEQRARDGKLTPDIERLHPRRLPWPFGVVLSRDELTAFARACF